MANTIYPPVLPSKQYSMPYHYINNTVASDLYFMRIQFEMPSMTTVDPTNGHCQVSIKYTETNRNAIKLSYTPDRGTLFITSKDCTNWDYSNHLPINPYFHKICETQKTNGDWTNVIGNIYEVAIPYRVFDTGAPIANTTYSVQIRFGGKALWEDAVTSTNPYGLSENGGFSNFAKWKKVCTTASPSLFGEWSNTTKIYCYNNYDSTINYNFDNFVPQLCWSYKPKNNEDPIASCTIKYSYQGMEDAKTVIKNYDGVVNGDNSYNLQMYIPVAPILSSIDGTITALTQNNTLIETTFSLPCIRIVDSGAEHYKGKYTCFQYGKVEDYKLTNAETEDGIIAKTMSSTQTITAKQSATVPYAKANKTINVYRVDLTTLDTVKIVSNQPLIANEKQTFKDYTVAVGERYEYIFCIMDRDNKLDEFFIMPTPYGKTNPGYARLMSMDPAFLNDRNHQLRLIGNLNISDYKRNVQDQFQTTIGSKYPFYSRASKQNYRTLQLSCVVSINFDPTATFLRLDRENGLFWDEGIQSSIDFLNIDIAQIAAIQEDIRVAQEEYDTALSKMKTEKYLKDQNYKITVDSEIAVALAHLEHHKTRLAACKNTRGTTHLDIWDEDIYSTEQFSLSRWRINKRYSGGAYLDQYLTEKVDDNSYIKGRSDKGDMPWPSDRTKPSNIGEWGGPRSIYSTQMEKLTSADYDTSNSARMIFMERKFRDRVMSWLSDGKPKLFRSEKEGNMIVMVTNVSFSPLDKAERKVYTMSCTLTEIADYDLDNLIDYNLIPSAIECDYSEVNDYDFHPGDVDPNIEDGSIFSIEQIKTGPIMLGKTWELDLSQFMLSTPESYTVEVIPSKYKTSDWEVKDK